MAYLHVTNCAKWSVLVCLVTMLIWGFQDPSIGPNQRPQTSHKSKNGTIKYTTKPHKWYGNKPCHMLSARGRNLDARRKLLRTQIKRGSYHRRRWPLLFWGVGIYGLFGGVGQYRLFIFIVKCNDGASLTGTRTDCLFREVGFIFCV